MPNTREENAAEMARDEVRHAKRKALVKACANDMADTLRGDQSFRLQVAVDGFEGFNEMSDEDLVKAAIDAGLHARNEVAEAIEILQPNSLG